METPKSVKRVLIDKELRASKKGKKVINYAEPESEEVSEDFIAPITPMKTPIKVKGPMESVPIYGDDLTPDFIRNLPAFALNCLGDKNWKWSPKTKEGYSSLQFNGQETKDVVFNVFGTIESPFLGIHGDFNDRYHDSIEGRYLMFNLASLDGYEDTHFAIMEKITLIENSISPNFENMAVVAQRPCKKALELQFKRKICANAGQNHGGILFEHAGDKLWEAMKGRRVPNAFPFGAYDNQG